jgi:hypothetical protein
LDRHFAWTQFTVLQNGRVSALKSQLNNVSSKPFNSMKNTLLVLSLFTAALVTACNKAENKSADQEPTTIESTTADRPANSEAGHNHETDHGQTAALYTCPMHPEVTSDKPGTCPKCGMKLEKADAAAKPEEPAQ